MPATDAPARWIGIGGGGPTRGARADGGRLPWVTDVRHDVFRDGRSLPVPTATTPTRLIASRPTLQPEFGATRFGVSGTPRHRRFEPKEMGFDTRSSLDPRQLERLPGRTTRAISSACSPQGPEAPRSARVRVGEECNVQPGRPPACSAAGAMRRGRRRTDCRRYWPARTPEFPTPACEPTSCVSHAVRPARPCGRVERIAPREGRAKDVDVRDVRGSGAPPHKSRSARAGLAGRAPESLRGGRTAGWNPVELSSRSVLLANRQFRPLRGAFSNLGRGLSNAAILRNRRWTSNQILDEITRQNRVEWGRARGRARGDAGRTAVRFDREVQGWGRVSGQRARVSIAGAPCGRCAHRHAPSATSVISSATRRDRSSRRERRVFQA